MKRSIILLAVVILASILGGCIISKTPNTNDVAMGFGEEMTFSVKVFPSATYTWTLDGAPLSNWSSNFTYTAQVCDHILEVKAKHFLGTDVQTWTIQTTSLPEPITQILDSLVTIPAGSFMMGSEDNEYGDAYSTMPVHEVTLSGFYIGAYEVTQAQYEAVMGTNPSYFRGTYYPDSENNPVEQVSWYEASEFCEKLSDITGWTFTLPSEAQWEYACRAGTTTLYSWGDSDSFIGDYAWWWYNSNGTGGPYGTHPVGTKLPNPWGLYDMQGNVWEWCLDSWHSNYTGAPDDGSAWEPETGSVGSPRMLRGGSWGYDGPRFFRSADRSIYSTPYSLSGGIGFRVLAVR